MSRSKVFPVIMALAVVLAQIGSLSAQEATPTPRAQVAGQLDLAAMALTDDDFGTQASLVNFGKVYSPVPASPDATYYFTKFTAEELAKLGARRAYSTAQIVAADLPQSAWVNLVLFETYNATFLQSLQASMQPNSEFSSPGAVMEARPLEGLGDSEGILVVDRAPASEGYIAVTAVSVWFKIANVVAWIKVSWEGTASTGNPSPVELATTQAERIRKVINGEPVSGVDYQLAEQMLKLGPGTSPEFEGYLAAEQPFGLFNGRFWTPYFVSGYRTIATTDAGDGRGATMPRLAVTLIELSSNEMADRVVRSRVTTRFNLDELTKKVELPPLIGSSEISASEYAYGGSGKVDSFSIAASARNYVITIDVDEALNGQIARGKALELMELQLACLSSSDPCTSEIVPPIY